MFIQNTEEIIRAYDLSSVLNIVILKKSKESLIPNSLTQFLQKVRAVEVDSVFVVVIILPIINGDIYIAFWFKEVNAIRPPPRDQIGVKRFVVEGFGIRGQRFIQPRFKSLIIGNLVEPPLVTRFVNSDEG